MSEKVSGYDHSKSRKRWASAYESVPFRAAANWLRDWKDVLEDLPYLRSMRPGEKDPTEIVGALQLVINLDANSLPGVQADIEKLWKTLSKGMEASHALYPSADGFLFQYGAMIDEQYVTGSISVSCRRAA
jgi:hypothetical protein